jgi:hypothetical protein
MVTVPVPPLSALDPNSRIVCPEGCAIWMGKAGKPWWIYTGGISTCVVCIIYEFNSPEPQIYFYHFIASGAALFNDFNGNLPVRLAGNMGLFRVRLYRNPIHASQNTANRINQLSGALNNCNRITVVNTNGGFNVRFSNGTFTDGVVGGPGMGRLINLAHAINTFNCMSDMGGVPVAKVLPGGW